MKLLFGCCLFFCSFEFSVLYNLIVNSAFSSLFTACLIVVFGVILENLVIFLFLLSCFFRE